MVCFAQNEESKLPELPEQERGGDHTGVTHLI